MLTRTRNRLFSVALLLGVLIWALPFGRTADAVVCCETCITTYEWCLQGISYPHCKGNSTCCAMEVAYCDQNCFWC